MQRTRLLLVDLPRLLREIVEDAVSAARHIEVVGEVEGAVVSEAVATSEADLIVLGRDDPRLVVEMLSAQPSMKVLAIICEGRCSALYELRPHRIPLGELSPERLVAVITEATAAG